MHNTVWSLVGYTLPLPVALIAIPILTRTLGTDRFGVLALAWALIGYSSIFDLGLGRALTKVVAERLETDDEQVPKLVSSTLALLAIVGGASAFLVFALSPILVDAVFKVPGSLREESIAAFRIMSCTLPFITMSAGLRGIFEAHQKFRTVGMMNSTTWSLMYLAPVLALPISHSLIAVMVALLLARVFTCAAYLWVSVRQIPGLRQMPLPVLGAATPAVKFGGWLTVSNIAAPFLTTVDRFVIGSMLSVGAVTFYTVPYDIVVRLGVFASAVTSVLFPVFSASFPRDRARTAQAYGWGLRSIAVIIVPLTLTVLVLAPEGLSLWLGKAFAEESAALLRWLTVGVFINCLVQVPFALIQAAGRPDLTARVHVLELAPYLVTLWILVSRAGITGAALAWSLRVTVDAVLMLFLAWNLFPEGGGAARKVVAAIGIAWLVGLAIQQPLPLALRLAMLCIFTAVYVPAIWKYALTVEEQRQGTQIANTVWAKLARHTS